VSYVEDLRMSLNIRERLVGGLAAVVLLVHMVAGVALSGYAIFCTPEHKGMNIIACSFFVLLSCLPALILIELCRPTTPTEDPDQTV